MSTGPSDNPSTVRGLSGELSDTAPPYRADATFGSPPARALLGGLVLVSLLSALDQAVVSTALPTIASDLGGFGGLAHLSTVVTAYLLAATLATPIWGRWGDRRGRSQPLLCAVGLFITASALCGLSRSMPELVAWRALQGAGGAGLAVGTQAVLAQLVPARQRPRYLSLFGMLFAAVSILGPAGGGLITDQLGWRWIFYLNLPIAGVALVVLAKTMPSAHPDNDERAERASRPTWAALRDRTFLTCAVITFISAFVILGITVYLPLFFQLVRGASPTSSGLRLLPMLTSSVATGLTCGWLIARRGRYKLFPVAGAAVATLGLILLSLVGPDTPEILVQANLVVIGVGMGGIGEILVVVAQESVPVAELGIATATLAVFRSVGGVLGTAGLGAVFTELLTVRLRTTSGQTTPPPAWLTTMTPAQLAHMPLAARHVVTHAYSSTLQTLLLIAAGLYSLVFLLILLLPAHALGNHAPGTPATSQPQPVSPPTERRSHNARLRPRTPAPTSQFSSTEEPRR